MSRSRLYILLSIACVIGYTWLTITYHSSNIPGGNEPDVCLFKKVTGIPCPSCGSTRAVMALMHGDIAGSLLMNPIGLILAMILLISPLWLIYDLLKRRSTLLWCYIEAENFIRKRQVAIPAILLLLMNWAWNIHKNL